MVAIKNAKKPNVSARKTKTLKRGPSSLMIACFIFLSCAVIVGGILYLSGGKLFKNSIFNSKKQDGGSLIEDDEKIYRDQKVNNQNFFPQTINNPAEKREVKNGDKSGFNPPKYDNKDKDYLNRLIKTR